MLFEVVCRGYVVLIGIVAIVSDKLFRIQANIFVQKLNLTIQNQLLSDRTSVQS